VIHTVTLYVVATGKAESQRGVSISSSARHNRILSSKKVNWSSELQQSVVSLLSTVRHKRRNGVLNWRHVCTKSQNIFGDVAVFNIALPQTSSPLVAEGHQRDRIMILDYLIKLFIHSNESEDSFVSILTVC
jgi:hypothetical protein